jgi:thioredoxin reductase (NADPH)
MGAPKAGTSSRIENYLGFPSGISGAELAERAMLQEQKFGARLAVPAEAASIEQDDGHYRVRLGDGTSLTSALVVLATGVRYRRLDLPRADYFEKMSIYYAASQAEALLCSGDPVAIIAGGNSAAQAAVFLSAHAAQVTLIVRGHDLGEHMSRYLVDEIARIPNVHVMTVTKVRELHGEAALEAVTVTDNQTGTRRTIDARRCSSSSAWPRAPAGSAGWSTSTIADPSAPGQVRTEPSARCWRPASPASSRSATSAPARPNESPRP